VPGAADDILRTLDAFGLHWDGEVRVQSARNEAYRAALAELEKLGAVYPAPAPARRSPIPPSAGIDGRFTPALAVPDCRRSVADGRCE